MKYWIVILNLIVAVALNVGCKHLSPEGKRFVALRTTQLSVDAAMKTYAAKVAAGEVSPEREEAIDQAHENFRVSFAIAMKLARYDYQAATPDNVSALANEVLNLIAQLKL